MAGEVLKRLWEEFTEASYGHKRAEMVAIVIDWNDYVKLLEDIQLLRPGQQYSEFLEKQMLFGLPVRVTEKAKSDE